MLIHIARPEGNRGPFPQEKVRQMLETGEISGDDLAWTEGAPGWAPLHTLLPASSPPPHPSQPPSIYAPPASVAAQYHQEISGGPTGIGGWLLFYCISLTILGPLVTAFSLSFQWQQAQPAFEVYPSIRTAMLIEGGGRAFLTLLGIVVGILIWARVGGALKIVKAYLIFRLVSFCSMVVVALMAMRDIPEESFTSAIGGGVGSGIRELIYFAIWFAYFRKSKRVYNTLGAGRQTAP